MGRLAVPLFLRALRSGMTVRLGPSTSGHVAVFARLAGTLLSSAQLFVFQWHIKLLVG